MFKCPPNGDPGKFPEVKRNALPCAARWCEIGCGQGYGMAVLAAANPAMQFVGIDINPRHIALAQSRADAAGLTNAVFLCGDIRDGSLVEGRFDSPFRGQPSPLVEAARRAQAERDKAAAGQETGGAAADPDGRKPEQVLGKVLERSPESARIILLASNTFLADTSLELASGAGGTVTVSGPRMARSTIMSVAITGTSSKDWPSLSTTRMRSKGQVTWAFETM